MIGDASKWLWRAVLVGCDLACLACALALALALREDYEAGSIDMGGLPRIGLIALLVQVVICSALHTWRGKHPIGSVEDATNVASAAFLVGAVVFLIDFFSPHRPVPYSVPLLATPIVVVLAVGSRVSFRAARERRYRTRHVAARRVIIYGAGAEGRQLLELMLADPTGTYLPVALLDDNPDLRTRRISGIAVCGTRADVAAAAERSGADLLVLANRQLPLDVIQDLAGAANDAELEVAMAPSLSELLMPVSVTPSEPASRVPILDAPGAGNGYTTSPAGRVGPPPTPAVLSPHPYIGGHSPTWLWRRVVLVMWDAFAWTLAIVLVGLRDGFDLNDVEAPGVLRIALAAIVCQLLIGAVVQTYCGRHLVGSFDEAVNVTTVMGLVGTAVFVLDFLVRPQLAPYSLPLLATPIAVLIAVGSRLAVRLHREHRSRPNYSHAQRVIVFGAGVEGQQLLRFMRADPMGSFLPVVLLDDDPMFRRRQISGVAVRGTRDDVAAAAARSDADLLVIADRSLPLDTVREVASTAHDAGLTVLTVRPLIELLQPLFPLPRRSTENQSTRNAPVDRQQAAIGVVLPARSKAKRAFDIILCLMGIVVALPLMLVIMVVLKIGDGQVIYRAQRVGRDGKPFTMFKFATMVAVDGPAITREGDPRITPIGRWLRVSKLNELPQIFNVLRGEMSLIGPRPEDPRYVVHYSDRQRQVLAARPGMTSPTFLCFGDEQAFIERVGPRDIEEFYLRELLPEKLDIELDYIEHWSMREDLRILACTLRGLVT